MMRSLRTSAAVVWMCLYPAARCSAQAANAALSGTVVDPSGAVIAHARIHLHSAGMDRDTTSDGAGHFYVAVPSAAYDLTVEAEGFRTYTREGVSVAVAKNPSLMIMLKIATDTEQVDVESNAGLSTDASANQSAMVFKGDQLDTFSDDPAAMQQQLLALAGSDPTNPPQLYVDGFSNGTLPPKESIREIRINQNPFSAQYDQFGNGRVEIFTKPGANKLHGSVEGSFNTKALNAQNPYAGAQPPYTDTSTLRPPMS